MYKNESYKALLSESRAALALSKDVTALCALFYIAVKIFVGSKRH